MRLILHVAILLYPRSWRDRYQQELEALIDDTNRTDAALVFDILKGALTMQLTQARHIGAFTLTGLALGFAAYVLIPNMYRATGVASAPQATSELLNDAASQVLSLKGIQDLIFKHELGSADPHHVEEIRRHIIISRVQQKQGASVLTVAFDAKDPRITQAVTQDLLERLIKALPGTAVIDTPVVPKGPIYPAPFPLLLIGTVGGLILGGVVALFRSPRRKPAADA